MHRSDPRAVRPQLDETDLDIVAALHIAPRVPTAALADILGIPTSTASGASRACRTNAFSGSSVGSPGS